MSRRDQIRMSDDEIAEGIEANQLRLLKERGGDMTIFSPRASAMEPHVGDAETALEWSIACNNMIHPSLLSFSLLLILIIAIIATSAAPP